MYCWISSHYPPFALTIIILNSFFIKLKDNNLLLVFVCFFVFSAYSKASSCIRVTETDTCTAELSDFLTDLYSGRFAPSICSELARLEVSTQVNTGTSVIAMRPTFFVTISTFLFWSWLLEMTVSLLSTWISVFFYLWFIPFICKVYNYHHSQALYIRVSWCHHIRYTQRSAFYSLTYRSNKVYQEVVCYMYKQAIT